MRKEIIIREIDCANCAAKIERKIQALEHVDSAVLNFMTETLIIEADDVHMNEISEQIKKIVYDVEPDAEIEGI